MHRLCRSIALCALVAVAAGVPDARAALVVAQAQPKIRPGMSQDEVRAAIGRPPSNWRIGWTGATIWRYVTTTTDTFFDVEFGPDGRVTSSGAIFVSPN